jgi:signal transduction histidine kinase
LESSLAYLVVSAGSAALATAATLWAIRITDGARGATKTWQAKAEAAEDKIQRWDSLFGAFPGVVIVWENEGALAEDMAKDNAWGSPRVYGSPMALGSLLRFSDAAVSPDPAVRILQGLASFKGRDAAGQDEYLPPLLSRLRKDGIPFSLTISNTQGVHIEVDGRTAGSRAVVWLVDASVKGLEERGGRGQLDSAREVIARDPAAFLDMLARAPFLSWRLNNQLKLEWVNAAYIQAIDGKGLDQVVARNAMLDPLMAEQAARAVEQGGEVEEVRQIVIGGQLRTMRLIMFPTPGGVGGMGFDVTEAEEARESLVRAGKSYDETLDSLGEGVVVFGPDRRMVFHNRAFAEYWGMDPAFLAEQPTHAAWLDALKEKRKLPAHVNYGDWRANELLAYQEGGVIPESLWQLPEGRTVRVARRRHPLGGLLIVFSDMTTEVTLKSQYAALLQVQKAALDKLHEGVVVFGLDGRVRLVNEAFLALWKLNPAQFEGDATFNDLAALCEPLYHNRAEWARIKGRITDPSPEARQEYRGQMRRADEVVVDFITRPLPDGDTIVAFIDVSAAKRVEDALRERAEAFEAADRLKTEFVENVSYQLRTPLQTITGYAEVLAKLMAGPLNDRQREQVQMILSASEGLGKLIDNILDVAMIEAGRLELEPTQVQIADLLQESVALASTKLRDSEVGIQLKFDPAIGSILADGKRLKQVLVNLVSNALRFTAKGDSIIVGAQRLDGVLRLWVQDTGRGIPLEVQASVFDQFASGDRRGAGLGLALVRSFIELHGGWVALESEPGRGTLVTCHIPILSGASKQAA